MARQLDPERMEVLQSTVVAGLVLVAITAAGLVLGVVIVGAIVTRPTTPSGTGQPGVAPGTARQSAAESQAVALGRVVYRQQCARCHGADAQGKVGPRLAGASLSPSVMEMVIRNGLPPNMPAFGSVLSPAQIQAVTSYISSLGSQPGRQGSAAVPSDGSVLPSAGWTPGCGMGPPWRWRR